MLKQTIIASLLFAVTGTFAFAQTWNVDVFGGRGFSDTLSWGGSDFDTDDGNIFGIGVSASDVFIPKLEVGLEYSTFKNEYTCCAPNNISADVIMLTAEYNFASSENFEFYGGGGLGAMRVEYLNSLPYSNSDTVAGGLLTLGVRYAVSDTAKVFVEGRYLSALDDPNIAFADASGAAEARSKGVVLGLRLSF